MNIIIADDHLLFRDGLKIILETEANFNIIAEHDNAADLKEAVIELQPDLVIADYNMPGGGSLTTLEYIKKRYSEIKVIALTGVHSGVLFKQMLNAGADGIFLKEMSAQSMLESVKKVMAGERVFSQTVEQYIKPEQDKLTAREFQIMDFIVSGLSSKDIAEKLNLSVKTIENHRYNLMQKLGLKSSVELVQYAKKQGLL